MASSVQTKNRIMIATAVLGTITAAGYVTVVLPFQSSTASERAHAERVKAAYRERVHGTNQEVTKKGGGSMWKAVNAKAAAEKPSSTSDR